MSYAGKSAISQYSQLDVSSAVENASPHRLIQMLMERALRDIGRARQTMEREEVVAKGVHIGHAIDVVNGLQASLNHKHDPKMSANFDELYGYMVRRLLAANLQNDLAILDEVDGLMRQLKEAWDAIADDPAGRAAAQELVDA